MHMPTAATHKPCSFVCVFNVFTYSCAPSRMNRQFGCDTLDGVEVEDGGGPGSAGSHWEKRLLGYEVMTASASKRPALSMFTLALFEDSGWVIICAHLSCPLLLLFVLNHSSSLLCSKKCALRNVQ